MGATVVSGKSVRRSVTMANPPDGLHLRPATAFARLARGFNCTVSLRHGEKVADGRSPTELIMLIALPGSDLELILDGDDADVAVEPLVAILTSHD